MNKHQFKKLAIYNPVLLPLKKKINYVDDRLDAQAAYDLCEALFPPDHRGPLQNELDRLTYLVNFLKEQQITKVSQLKEIIQKYEITKYRKMFYCGLLTEYLIQEFPESEPEIRSIRRINPSDIKRIINDWSQDQSKIDTLAGIGMNVVESEAKDMNCEIICNALADSGIKYITQLPSPWRVLLERLQRWPSYGSEKIRMTMTELYAYSLNLHSSVFVQVFQNRGELTDI